VTGSRPGSHREVDRTFSLGAQLSGVHWNRPLDRVGLAFAQNGLSAAHRAYLAAGGTGLNLGDGRLNRGAEQDIEVYYAITRFAGTRLSKRHAGLDRLFEANPLGVASTPTVDGSATACSRP
jgi:hypothetical protein